jgi:hypothetical protein
LHSGACFRMSGAVPYSPICLLGLQRVRFAVGETLYLFFFVLFLVYLILIILLMWRIWRAPNNASRWKMGFNSVFNPLKAELNPIDHFLALLGAYPILHISGVRVKDNSSHINNTWSNGTKVNGVCGRRPCSCMERLKKTTKNLIFAASLPRFEPGTLRMHCSSSACSTATFVVEPYFIRGSWRMTEQSGNIGLACTYLLLLRNQKCLLLIHVFRYFNPTDISNTKFSFHYYLICT